MSEVLEIAFTGPDYPRQVFIRGMRVITREGNWPDPRGAGHYGKVVDLKSGGGNEPSVYVQITGHVDGGPWLLDEFDWYWPEELTVVD